MCNDTGGESISLHGKYGSWWQDGDSYASVTNYHNFVNANPLIGTFDGVNFSMLRGNRVDRMPAGKWWGDMGTFVLPTGHTWLNLQASGKFTVIAATTGVCVFESVFDPVSDASLQLIRGMPRNKCAVLGSGGGSRRGTFLGREFLYSNTAIAQCRSSVRSAGSSVSDTVGAAWVREWTKMRRCPDSSHSMSERSIPTARRDRFF